MSTDNKVGFVSLGCPKALVDSERILTQLRIDGYEIVSTYQDAGLVVVNTCGFIDSAVEESLQAIGEALDENGKVVVTGCLGVDSEKILAKYPQVLAVTGPQAYEEVVTAVRRQLPQHRIHNAFADLLPPQGIKLTPRHYAYLKISEGCNHRCSFCIIPSLRGDLRSRPAGQIMIEAEHLVNAGVKELLVISQDTSAYGVDIKYRSDFWGIRPVKSRLFELSEAMASLGVWVRLHYVYPYPHVDKLIPLMAEGKILPYLDIPFQHANARILKAMKRPAASENNLQRIKKWRQICPQLTIRSTFIVGFPGETEAEFEELLGFMEESQLDRVGCFEYSPVKGAAANAISDAVPDALKKERWQRFMALQTQISKQKLLAKTGKTLDVIIDKIDGQSALARSHADAPEIDGRVYLELPENTTLEAGDRIEVKVTDSDEHDLWAVL